MLATMCLRNYILFASWVAMSGRQDRCKAARARPGCGMKEYTPVGREGLSSSPTAKPRLSEVFWVCHAAVFPCFGFGLP